MEGRQERPFNSKGPLSPQQVRPALDVQHVGVQFASELSTQELVRINSLDLPSLDVHQ